MTVNIHQAKTHPSQLIRRVQRGEEVIIARAGRPVSRLVPVAQPPTNRTPGSAKGKIKIARNFDAPMPREFMRYFE